MSTVRALALYEFEASAEVELSLKPGDIIKVSKKNAGDGWCEGELNGKRGLFPKAFVRIITFGKGTEDDDEGEETTDTNSTSIQSNSIATTRSSTTPTNSPLALAKTIDSSPSKTPLTPMTSKKVFMETLLTPTPDTIQKVYNLDKARELFLNGQEAATIGSGPTWKNRPPQLTIAVHDSPKSIRSSGVKMQKTYDVSTKELKVSVIRKYKHFLWLYDQLADKVPCISLPPLPIKQSQLQTSGPSFVDAQRRGLERFLNRVARHPVLGSTRIFHLFLTAIDEKEWRIGSGKHASLIRSGGGRSSSKKILSAPIYQSVQYPPYNVPINQLASFDKFSKFTGTLETNLSNMRKACETLKAMHGQTSSCLRLFGKDIQNLAEGADQPSLGARYRKPSQGGVVSLPNSGLAANLLPLAPTSPGEESDSDDDDARNEIGEWNWREDENFKHLMTQLHDLGSCIRQTSLRAKKHQELLSKDVIEGLEEYSAIVHTLPVLVKLHEDAMTLYNESKQKGSKAEAEDVRQDCETLNNILLAEFDYFSQQVSEDLQKVILALMKAEAEYHKKMASDWENMYTSFSENKPIRRTTVKRSTTLPGAQEGNSPPTQPTRPNSTDRHLDKTGVSPPISRRMYVNITDKVPSKPSGEEPLYENLPKQKSKSTSANYENWTPKPPENNKTYNHNSATLPFSTKPIPPPLIIKRHELSNTSEAERIGNQTDSFIVPNLVPNQHYSQVCVGNSFESSSGEHEEEPLPEDDEEWKKQQAKIEEMGRALFNEVHQEIPNVENSLTTSDNSSSESERKNTLTPGSTNSHMTDDEKPKKGDETLKKDDKEKKRTQTPSSTNGDQKSNKEDETLKKDNKGAQTNANLKNENNESTSTKVHDVKNESKATHSPQTKSRLAQLTQLPQQRKDETTTSTPPFKTSKSFHHSGSHPVKTKGLYKSATLDNTNKGQSELIKRLERQRMRLDKQLSVEGDPVPTNNGTDLKLGKVSTNESLFHKDGSSNSLSKFGIVEEGGSFIV